MRKEEYLQKLEKLLYNIPAEDREDALQFYRDYLEDAAEEAEEVLAALGSPEELAQSIRRDLYGDNAEGDFTRSNRDLPGSYRVPFSKDGKFSGAKGAYSEGKSTYGGYYEYDAGKEKKVRKGKLSAGQWIIFLIICLCAAPVIVPICGGLIAAVIGILAVILGLVFGIGVAGIALVIAAIAIVIVALVKLIATPLSALIMLGGGLLSAGLGLVGIALTLWIVCKVLPAIFRWVVSIFYGIVHR